MVFIIYKLKRVGYIGSTQSITSRMNQHRRCCNCKKSKKYKMKLYKYIRKHKIKIEPKILGIYKRDCSLKIRRLVEQYWINKYTAMGQAKFNKIKAFLDKKETKIKRIKQNKTYYEANKKERLKKNPCLICGGKYSYYTKKRHENSKRHKKCLEIMNK
jgi:uncharacterized protein YcbK (DUF882 family)